MKIKSAVVGLGFIGKTHIEGHVSSGSVELKALVDSNEALGKEVAEKYGVKHYRTIDELFAGQNIDMIDICLPTYLHEACILQAVSAGKHVLCEKPVTLTMESFQRIKEAVNLAGVKFMLAQVLRFWPEYERITELRDKRLFGTVKMLHAHRFCEVPNWAEWYKDPLKSGGALYDLMLHDYDYVLNFVGRAGTVFATGAQNERGCWNHVQTNIRFDNGISAVVEGCNEAFGHYPFSMGLKVFGDKMIADYSLTAGHNLDSVGTRALHTYVQGSDPVRQKITEYDAYAAEITYFADCIASNRQPDKVSLESSEKTLELVNAVKKSLESKREVKFG